MHGYFQGQSVPHLHVHILPRKKGDFNPNDAIYSHLETFGLDLHKDMEERALVPDASIDRKGRSADEMKREADWLRKEMAN